MTLVFAAVPAAAQAATLVAVTDRFELHSDAWINLHHFLYQWARADAGLDQGRRRVHVAERSELATLSNEERAAWIVALGFYRASVAPKGHFDREMLQVKRELLHLSGNPRKRPTDRIPGIAAALSAVMPVYLKSWWPQHDKANRAWIEQVRPHLIRHEKRFVEMTARVHGSDWPRERWRADISAYANWAGGYTTSEGHIVIYSRDSNYQDLNGFEILLHEVQHAEVILGKTPASLERAFAAAGTKPPPNLWHALIFATAGEFVRSVAESEGRAVHTPAWIQVGIHNLEGWREIVPVVNQHWLPVIRGERSREEGVGALARALQSPN
jgi:hypothetical protein